MRRFTSRIATRAAGVPDARGVRDASRARRGFTLIELLIAVTIFLILAAVTVAAVNAFQAGDRISGSARQVQSFISGARDRAIYTNRTDEGPRARGVRLLVDQGLTDANGDPFACTAMQYVESAGYFPPRANDRLTFGLNETLFLASDDPNTTGATEFAELLPPADLASGNPISNATVAVRPFDNGGDGNKEVLVGERLLPYDKKTPIAGYWAQTPLNRVFQAGLLGERATGHFYTTRVRLPKYANGAGRWYRALIVSAGAPGAAEQTQRLAGIARVFLMTQPNEDPVVYNGNAAEDGYVFELRTVPLAGEDPRPLPNQTAIDLRSAAALQALPAAWSQTNGARPGIPIPQGPLDIMFDPSGLVTGPLAAAGLVHLPVVSLDDLDLGSNAYDAGGGGRGYASGAFLPLGYVGTNPDAAAAYDPATGVYAGPGKSGSDLIVTVNTQTGTVTVAPVDVADARNRMTGDPTPDGLADDPLFFAETGTEAQ